MPDTPAVPGDAGGLREANRRLRELLAGRDAQLAAQAAENAELRALVASLRAQVADLAARVKTNSRNSSRPPSADGLSKPAPKSLRKKTGRGPGRPKGQPGATMELTDHPDRVVRHEPSCCAGCGADLDGAPETGAERRQVTEIPPVSAEVTEHQLIERQCSGCGTRTKGHAPDGVNAPVQYGPRAAALGTYLWHGQFLSRDRAAAALAEMFGVAPSGPAASPPPPTSPPPVLSSPAPRRCQSSCTHSRTRSSSTAGSTSPVTTGAIAASQVRASAASPSSQAPPSPPPPSEAWARCAAHWARTVRENDRGDGGCGQHLDGPGGSGSNGLQNDFLGLATVAGGLPWPNGRARRRCCGKGPGR